MATRLIPTGIALLALALAGCRTSPRIDDHFGEAVRANLAAQALRPEASGNTNPAAGVDGRAARAAQQRYEKSFEQTEQQAAPSIIPLGTGQ
ncbi:hypothetical protein NX774_14725 [Massilia agilis]|uniref:Pilus assembly protein n=1 Tax=Massilia agilis TaxID=1811226 RepID=A0ABT2DD39_9BURK|nr:hypothetical protein [Massilia agilis]MCS0809182.1 hypothetical protein [Massilia agilis]